MPNHPKWDYIETIEIIKVIPNDRVQNFARIAYLLGSRISETLPITKRQIRFQDDLIFININSLKTRKGRYIYREIVVSRKEEPFYCATLLEFYSQADDDQTIGEWIGLGGVRTVEKYIERYFRPYHPGVVPHSFRHLRETHIAKEMFPTTIHRPTAAYLKYYFGQKSLSTVNHYVDDFTVHDILRGRART